MLSVCHAGKRELGDSSFSLFVTLVKDNLEAFRVLCSSRWKKIIWRHFVLSVCHAGNKRTWRHFVFAVFHAGKKFTWRHFVLCLSRWRKITWRHFVLCLSCWKNRTWRHFVLSACHAGKTELGDISCSLLVMLEKENLETFHVPCLPGRKRITWRHFVCSVCHAGKREVGDISCSLFVTLEKEKLETFRALCLSMSRWKKITLETFRALCFSGRREPGSRSLPMTWTTARCAPLCPGPGCGLPTRASPCGPGRPTSWAPLPPPSPSGLSAIVSQRPPLQ